ncbi:hypothetical protein L596_019899 [Steinernema carpocapsae]|uniref:Uncharacterized protein n=1 Tax=Steinernema carpocapsae TaxID=34508 RepID=A0A4U5MS15_STECR|nr:hypothetical protein L596_019899 [Steinernema carpocapsae]
MLKSPILNGCSVQKQCPELSFVTSGSGLKADLLSFMASGNLEFYRAAFYLNHSCPLDVKPGFVHFMVVDLKSAKKLVDKKKMRKMNQKICFHDSLSVKRWNRVQTFVCLR